MERLRTLGSGLHAICPGESSSFGQGQGSGWDHGSPPVTISSTYSSSLIFLVGVCDSGNVFEHETDLAKEIDALLCQLEVNLEDVGHATYYIVPLGSNDNIAMNSFRGRNIQ